MTRPTHRDPPRPPPDGRRSLAHSPGEHEGVQAPQSCDHGRRCRPAGVQVDADGAKGRRRVSLLSASSTHACRPLPLRPRRPDRCSRVMRAPKTACLRGPRARATGPGSTDPERGRQSPAPRFGVNPRRIHRDAVSHRRQGGPAPRWQVTMRRAPTSIISPTRRRRRRATGHESRSASRSQAAPPLDGQRGRSPPRPGWWRGSGYRSRPRRHMGKASCSPMRPAGTWAGQRTEVRTALPNRRRTRASRARGQ